MTHLLQPPEPVAVEMDADGQPSRFRWRGAWHAVAEVANHWRVDSEWWREEQSVETFELLTESGLLCHLVHDRLVGTWCLERIFE